MRLPALALLVAASAGASTVNLTYSGTITSRFPGLADTLSVGDTWTLSLELELTTVRSPFQPYGPTQLGFPGAVTGFSLTTSGAWGGVSMGTASGLSPQFRLHEDGANGDTLYLEVQYQPIYPAYDPGYAAASSVGGEPFAQLSFAARHGTGFFTLAGHPAGASLADYLDFGASDLMPSGGSAYLAFGQYG